MTGPERIAAAFARAQAEARAALVVYLMAGDPDPVASPLLFAAAAQGGADIIEIGIPFSDPLADGPTIQAAGQRALASGMTVAGSMALARRLSGGSEPGGSAPDRDVPFVFMTYYNVILRYGLERFVTDALAAGVSGAIVPDLPPDEADEWVAACGEGFAPIFLVAPTSTPARIDAACSHGGGFVYAVSTTGVTGARRELSADLGDFVSRIREASGLPVAVGFGVSTPDQAVQVGRLADGVIVGSAVIDAGNRARSEGRSVGEAVRDTVRALREGVERG